jgi:hypothetical protein
MDVFAMRRSGAVDEMMMDEAKRVRTRRVA